MTHTKKKLPSKICKNCKKPFFWRKKLRNNWANVLYCSKKCSYEQKNIINL